jgi:asparagine synthase (glutamine-hydrolysing)
VASIAAAIGLPGLAAWSAYCPGFAQTDERRWMRDVVEMYGLPWHLVNLEQALPFSAPPGRFIGEPTIAVINQAQTRAADELLSANGVEVLLSGHGGDAVLGAFPGPEPTALADPLFEFDLASALTGLRHWRRESTERRSYSYWVKNCLWAPSVRHLRGHGIASAPRLPMQPWLRKDYAARWDLERRRLRRYARPCRTPGRQQLADSLWVAALQRSLDAQRRRSFTTRSPLMARPLVEFMAGIPFDQRMRPRCDRYLQRRALRGILPESVRRRAGKGVGTPVFVEGLSRSPAWIDYLTDGSRLAAHGIADPDRWGSAVRQAAVGQTHGDQFFHAGLALEVWFRQLEAHRRSIAGQFAAPPFPSGGAARPSDSHATCPASRPLPPARS